MTRATPRPASESYLVAGATLVSEGGSEAADVLVSEGRIVAVDTPGALAATETIDAEGLWLLPGAIDTHVHPIHNESFESTGAAAPFGGVTTVLHHLYPNPGESIGNALARATLAATTAAADVGFHVRLSPDQIADGIPQVAAGGATAVKLFLAYGDTNFEVSLGDVYEAMVCASAVGLRVYIHAELGDVVRRAEQRKGAPASLQDWNDMRPPELEAAAVHAVCAIARMTDCALHLPHLSSATAVRAAVAARGYGTDVTLETCPHYLFLTKDSEFGGLVRCAPPLRDDDDVAALRAAAMGGALDLVASDHCGYERHDKDKRSVAKSSNGIPGLENLLPLLLDAAITGRWLTPERVVGLLATGPARVFGLAAKGRIAPGADADMVLVDPGGSTTVRQRDLHDSSCFSPYEGHELRGRIVSVFRRGEQVVHEGRAVVASGGRRVQLTRMCSC